MTTSFCFPFLKASLAANRLVRCNPLVSTAAGIVDASQDGVVQIF